MAEDKTKQPDEELQDEQLDEVVGGMSPFEVPYPPGIPDPPEPTRFGS